MRYLLIILLSFVSFTACAQIRARQIRVDSNYADLQVIVNDTVNLSSTYRLGKFLNFYDLLTDYLDSLGIVYPSDTDWLKYRTPDVVPTNDDTIYHRGAVLIGSDSVLDISGGWGKEALNVIGRFDIRFPDESGTNIGIGDGSLSDGMSGTGNFALGQNALNAITSGNNNIAIGNNSMLVSTSGFRNTVVGSNTMTTSSGLGAQHNSLLGFEIAAANSLLDGNVGIGYQALYEGATSNNVAIGKQAGYSRPVSNNTFIGFQAGRLNTGSGNVFLGKEAGENETGSDWLYIDNSNTSSPLIKGNFAADTLHIFGKLGYATDGGTPDRLAGLSSSQFTSIFTGFGIMLDGDTLKVDTTQVGGGGGSGGANLTIEGAGPIYSVASSSGTDVWIETDTTINLSEPGADTLMFKVDTTIIATQYDLTTLDEDDDWYKLGTTDPPTAITDTMYHTGITAIGRSVGADMHGALNIGDDGGANVGLVISDYSDSRPFVGIYPIGVDTVGWEWWLNDALDFWIENADEGTRPFGVEYYAPSGSFNVTANGDIYYGEYPNTRDDGTAANFLGTDINGVMQSYDIDDVISEWLLAATGTPGTEAITDGETVTFSAAGAATVARSGSTITYTVTEGDGSTTNEAWTIDATGGDTELISNQTVLFQGGGINATTYSAATNTLTITATEVDGSVSNELQTVQENDVTPANGTNINTFDFGTLFDISAATGEAEINIDLGEAATVTTAQTDDYVILYDNGTGIEEKILVTDLDDAITANIDFYESNTYEGTGYQIDFGTGMDLTMTGVQADVSLDFSEFTTDAAPEGDEFVVLYDGAGTQEKVAITYFTGLVDFNFAEDDLTFTGNRSHDMDIYSLTLHGDVNNVKFLDDNGGTGDNIIVASELGAGTGVTGGISFEYENGGVATDQFDIEANKRSSTKQTLEIQAEQDTDAAITFEKNSGLADNTTESHIALNGGIAFTQNYEWTGTASDLTLDRSYHIVNVSGAGAIGDEINLPEVVSNGDNWTSTMTDAQAQVGQEYVITNWRSGVDLVIRAFTGDQILENDGTAVVTSYTLGDLESVIIKCVRLNAGVGYWVIYK